MGVSDHAFVQNFPVRAVARLSAVGGGCKEGAIENIFFKI